MKILLGEANQNIYLGILKDSIIVTVTIGLSIIICNVSKRFFSVNIIKWFGIK